MAITKYTLRNPVYAPWRDLEDVSNRLSRFFDQPESNTDRSWTPSVNVSEAKEELLLTAELPGLGEGDVTLELENNVLTISGEKVEQRRYHVWERRYGSFKRAFTLPRTVASDDITANFHNGVLTVRLPKAPEAKGRKIEITKA